MKNYFLVLGSMICISVQAQDKKPDLNAVTAKFPDAMAVWLEKKTDIDLSWDNGTVKINQQEYEEMLFTKDESGSVAGSNNVYYSYFHKLKEWEAFTLMPDGKKIKVTNSTTHSSSSSFVFVDDSRQIEFLYPAVTKGARGITKADYELTDAHLLSPFYFESYFPVINGQLTISYPKEIELNYIIKGLNKNAIAIKKETRKGKTTLTFNVSDIPGINYYADAPPSSYYLTHVIFYIEKLKNNNGVAEPFLGTVPDLAKYYFSHIKELDVNGGNEVKEVTDSLLKGITNPIDKAKAIYKWVQQSVRYIAFEEGMGGFVPRNPELVCTRRYGDCKDKSALLVSMLRYAGLNAHFTWIGSRQLPYKYSEVPLPVTDDHMICALEMNGRYIFMDATDSYIPFDVPASHIQGKEAFIVKSATDYHIENVPVMENTYSVFSDTTFLSFENKKLKGKIKIEITGYETNDIMHRLESRTGKAREEFLQSYCYRGNNKIIVKNIQLSIDTIQNRATILADFDLPDYAKFLGNELYVNMNLSKLYTNQEIDYPKRKVPIEAEFNGTIRQVVVLQPSEGYKVTTVPSIKSYSNDVWGVTLGYEQKGNDLIYQKEFRNNHLYLFPESFEKWNKVLENLFPVYKQSVVLSK